MEDYLSVSRFQLPEPGAQARRPAATFIPKHYEPGYAYPLLVLFHGRGGDEHQLLRVMPKLSARNYVAVALRGPEVTPRRRDGSLGYGWGQAARGAKTGEGVASLQRPRTPALSEATADILAGYVSQAICGIERHVHINRDRVFLVGYGEGATAAYRLGLGMPRDFAGLVAINGWLPRSSGPLLRLPDARRLRVLIGHGRDNELVPASAAHAAHRLLYTAGIDTTFRLIASGHRIHGQLLNLINHWLIESCQRMPAKRRESRAGKAEI